jgi:transcriptional regulator with XRE-family HTH domain
MCDIINSTKGAGDMENVNIVLAANILKYRKKSGLSQEELANKLGVTSQAVSKWENAKAAPDIAFLPIMADVFGCHIDELFSREVKTEIHYDHCAELPWADDNTIRIFQTVGKKIMKLQEANTCIEVTFPRNCNETTRQYFKVEVFGNIVSDSSINGDVVCHGKIDCHEINGDVNAQGDISAYQINSPGKIICNDIKKK